MSKLSSNESKYRSHFYFLLAYFEDDVIDESKQEVNADEALEKAIERITVSFEL